MADKFDDLDSKLQKLAGENGEPVHLMEDEDTGHRFLIYSTQSGMKVQLRYEGDGLWMSQGQMAELFGVDVRTVNEHILNVYRDSELSEIATNRKFRIVRKEGSREVARELNHYNLDMVISVGYRVSSKQGTLFRRWATAKLVQFATKGFVVDVERLKAPSEQNHFKELRELIREIRSSEANLYRELREIIALCSDYSALDDGQKNAFFATVQNKLLYAVSGMTGPEIRISRANASLENMGLTTWKGRHPIKSDIYTAKNYLGSEEIRDFNRFTNMLLDYFEQETELQRLVTTSDAEFAVDKFIKNNDRNLLRSAGQTSRKDADLHCEKQYDMYKDMRLGRYLKGEDEE